MKEHFSLDTSRLLRLSVDQGTFTMAADVFLDHLLVLVIIPLVCIAITRHHAMNSLKLAAILHG